MHPIDAPAEPLPACLYAGRQRLKVIQIHPTLNCNLTCLHCYSGSAPHFKNHLPPEPLMTFLNGIADCGFGGITLSGGEPMMYRHAEELLRHSRSLGLYNGMVTNAMLLETDRARRILGLTDLVAISIDGEPDYHDKIRRSPVAFAKMTRGIEVVRTHTERYGFIQSVCRSNWESMLWVADFAHDNGAKLLQIHPLEQTGRATQEMAGESLTELDQYRVFMLYNYLQAKHPDMTIQLDMLPKEYAIDWPQLIYTDDAFLADSTAPIETGVDFLVINENGLVLPLPHGADPYWALGSIYEGISLREMLDRFNHTRLTHYKRVVAGTLAQVTAPDFADFFNWSEWLLHRVNDELTSQEA